MCSSRLGLWKLNLNIYIYGQYIWITNIKHIRTGIIDSINNVSIVYFIFCSKQLKSKCVSNIRSLCFMYLIVRVALVLRDVSNEWDNDSQDGLIDSDSLIPVFS